MISGILEPSGIQLLLGVLLLWNHLPPMGHLVPRKTARALFTKGPVPQKERAAQMVRPKLSQIYHHHHHKKTKDMRVLCVEQHHQRKGSEQKISRIMIRTMRVMNAGAHTQDMKRTFPTLPC
jgi:hypothetical protein